MKKVIGLGGLIAIFVSQSALAHVAVKPDKAGVGSYQTFTISVPSEKPLDTIELSLQIPAGVTSVTPTVKAGWRVISHVVKESGQDRIDRITWMGGEIPQHMRDEFSFSAKVPSEEATLSWKAYQKYSDGSVVSWDLDRDAEQPKDASGNPDFSKSGPYSVTKVVNDLNHMPMHFGIPEANAPLIISILALICAIGSLAIAFRR
jgi:uncharacterized protein YcnI